jgi:hypothetical protein
MIITPTAHQIDILAGSGAGRAPGCHVSDLYNGLYQVLQPQRYTTGGTPPAVKMAMGLAWEQYLEKVLVASGIQAHRPGEFKTPEGPTFSPDLLITNGSDRIGEMKLTYMAESPDLADPKFAKWLTQVKTYAYHLQIPRATIWALFVNGNYRNARDPVLRQYDLEFTAQELKAEWSMLIQYGKSKGLL